jgi:hypothetical protein
MNVEIGAEAALFPEKEYINGIFVAVIDKQVTVVMRATVWDASNIRDVRNIRHVSQHADKQQECQH